MSPFSRRSLLSALLLPLAAAAAAQPSLVADLSPSAEDSRRFPPATVHGFGSLAVFASSFDSPELWRTDGTEAGTWKLFDVCPHRCGIPEPVAVLDGHLFLSADLAGFEFDPPHDAGPPPTWLLRTDGMVEGTVVLGGPFYLLEWLGNVGEVALFEFGRAAGGAPYSGLLVADREHDEPVLLLPFDESVRTSTVSGGDLYFATSDGLWRSDGTEAGTRQIDDRGCRKLAAVEGGAVVCWGDDDAFSVSDGGRLRPLAPTGPRTPLSVVTDGAGRAFYLLNSARGDELWVTDGTAAGTRRLDTPREIGELAGHDGRAYFAATDAFGSELWTSDGTPLGTRRLTDLCPGPCSSHPRRFVEHAGGLLFSTESEPDGVPSLWHLGADEEAPRRLLAAAPGSVLRHRGDAYLTWAGRLIRVDARLAVHDLGPADGWSRLAAAGPWVLFRRGDALWRTDGTAAGSAPIASVEAPAAGSDIHSMIEFDGRLCFIVSDAPWCTAPGGVVELPWEEGERASWLSTLRGELLVGGSSFAVYRDLAAPPVRLPSRSPSATGRAEVDGVLYFVLHESFRDQFWGYLWRTDGTPEGTRQIAEIDEPAAFPGQGPIALGDRVLFVTDGHLSESLWSTDGTAEGTVVLHQERAFGPTIRPTRFRGALWFSAGGKLWRTDGTPDGTLPVFDIGWFDDGPLGGPRLLALPERLLIAGGMPFPEDPQVWVTDGVRPPERLEFPVLMNGRHDGGRFYYRVLDENGDVGLAVTDGTAAGTGAIELPGVGSPGVEGAITAIDGQVLFTAPDLAHGWELWTTDGTAAGTRRVVDLAPGPASSRPEQMTRVGDRLYFVADDGRSGRELWSLPWSQVTGEGSCQPSETRLCLGDGRFAVTVRWRDQVNGGEGSGRAVPLPGSDDSGTFWFFDPGNVELIVKALDGTPVNGHHWLFYGALSTVEYWIDVLDTVTGQARRYHNPPGQQCGRGDTAAFPGAVTAAASPHVGNAGVAAPAASCGDPGALCLLGGSLAVEVSWHDPRSGDRGTGVPIVGSDNSGYFWFFDDENVELVVKALDGTTVNGHRWFFYGGLSDVEYEIRVTETATGTERVYRNPFGEICGGSDTAAF